MNQLLQILLDFWEVLAVMAPYLLLGFGVAGLLSVLIAPRLVERHLGGHGFWPILKAAMLGVPLPLCSCGVIPVAASLRRHGASKAATVSFLIATPETGVDSIAVTYSLMGGVFALFRPLGALINGVVGGLAVSILGKKDEQTTWDAPRVELARDDCAQSCCASPGHTWTLGSKVRQIIQYGFVDLPRDIGKSLLIGLVIAALITAFIPPDFFRTQAGGFFGHGIGSMLLMMAVGIPMYVCATASVPMAMALVMKGVSPGAALVFLMTGPATNAATIAMIWRVMGRRTAGIYLVSIAACALGMGFLLDWLFAHYSLSMPAMMHDHQMDKAGPFNWAAAIALLAILGYALLRRTKAMDVVTESVLMTETLRIQGMTCSHCAGTVKRALGEVTGVESAEVDLAGGRAVVTGEALDRHVLKRAVENVGYRVE